MARGTICWDIDGTLVRSRQRGFSTHSAAVERVIGASGKGSAVEEMSGRTDRALLLDHIAALGATSSPELIVRCQTECDDLTHQWVKDAPPDVLAGVGQVLSSLRNAGYRNVLLTGNSIARSKAKLDQANLAGHFDWSLSVFGDQYVERVDMARVAARRFLALDGVLPVIVGDTVNDVNGGLSADLAVVAVATGSCGMRDLEAAGASLVLSTLAFAETPILQFLAGVENSRGVDATEAARHSHTHGQTGLGRG